MKCVLSTLSPLFFLAGCLAFGEPTGTTLWNGKDLSGWELIADPTTAIESVCHLTPSGAVAVEGKPVGFLQTKGTYENYKLHAEWRWTSDKPSNSGFLIHITTGPKDRAWPECFQVQTKMSRAGDIIPMAGASCPEFNAATQKQVDRQQAASEKPSGEWNSCDIICRGDVIECSINGIAQNKVTHCEPHAGRVGLQLEGYPFEVRNMTLTPLEK